MSSNIYVQMTGGKDFSISCKNNWLITLPSSAYFGRRNNLGRQALTPCFGYFDACLDNHETLYIVSCLKDKKPGIMKHTLSGWDNKKLHIPHLTDATPEKLCVFYAGKPYCLFSANEKESSYLWCLPLEENNHNISSPIAKLTHATGFDYALIGTILCLVYSDERSGICLSLFLLPDQTPLYTVPLLASVGTENICCALKDTRLYVLFSAGKHVLMSSIDTSSPNKRNTYDINSDAQTLIFCHDKSAPYALIKKDNSVLRMDISSDGTPLNPKKVSLPLDFSLTKHLLPSTYIFYPTTFKNKNNLILQNELVNEIHRLQRKVFDLSCESSF